MKLEESRPREEDLGEAHPLASRQPCGNSRRTAAIVGIASSVLALLLIASTVRAQARSVEIASGLTCSSCVVEFAQVAILGDFDAPGDLGGAPQSIARDSAGFFWVSVYGNDPVKVFSPSGRYYRTVGRSGKGPDEYTGPLTVRVSPEDSIMVLDGGNARLSVHTSSGGYHRMAPLPFVVDRFTVGPHSTFVASGNVRTASAAGLPLHLIDSSTGRILRSFGAEIPVLKAALPRALAREIAFSGPAHVWSALPTRYVIERWNIESGELTDSFVRKPPWFEPHWLPQVIPPSPDAPPAPYITGVAEDSQGRLWVYMLVADANWKQALGPMQVRGAREIYPVTDINKYYDTVVEIIDVKARRVVARGRADGAFPVMIDFNHVAALDVASMNGGAYRASVWKVTLSITGDPQP
jgi:hypothetical protein